MILYASISFIGLLAYLTATSFRTATSHYSTGCWWLNRLEICYDMIAYIICIHMLYISMCNLRGPWAPMSKTQVREFGRSISMDMKSLIKGARRRQKSGSCRPCGCPHSSLPIRRHCPVRPRPARNRVRQRRSSGARGRVERHCVGDDIERGHP